MITNALKHGFIIDNRSTIVNINTLALASFQIMLGIVLNCNITQVYQSQVKDINIHSLLYQLPIIVHSISTECPLSQASGRHHPPLNKESQNNICNNWFPLQYTLINLCLNDIIDCNLDGIDPITVAMDVYGIIYYNLDATDPITVRLPMTKQMQYRCLVIRNVIEF